MPLVKLHGSLNRGQDLASVGNPNGCTYKETH